MPVAVATALYVTELCPATPARPVTILIELLAAVPSVVYGLWGIFFLAPKLQPAEQWVADRLSFVPFIGGGMVTIPNYFIAGLVLAIMILPIVSAICARGDEHRARSTTRRRRSASAPPAGR